MQFLFDKLDRLFCIDVTNAIDNGRRILSAIVIICCLNKMVSRCIKLADIPSDRVATLLSMLRVMPDMQNRKCEDWDYVKSFTESFRKEAFESVLALTVHLSHTKYFSIPDWMYAIPVVHFLKPVAVPFQEIELDPRKIPWVDKLIDLQTIRSHVSNHNTR